MGTRVLRSRFRSGVATLSCSASSSSGTSDITEPCSPYSPASSTQSESGDDHQQKQQRPWPAVSKMAPNVPSEGEGERENSTGSWPWAGTGTVSVGVIAGTKDEERGPPPPPPPLLTVVQRRAATPRSPPTSPPPSSPSLKRMKVDHHHHLHHAKRCCKAAAAAARQQGKITEYFKTQAKPVNGAKKELVAHRVDTGKCRMPPTQPKGPAVCLPPMPAVGAEASPPTTEREEVPPHPAAQGGDADCDTSSAGAKPPILTVPRTIRFPALQCAKTPTQLEAQDVVVCQWSDCDMHFETSTALLEHLQVNHVNPQTQSQISCEGENYVCLWTSCKVYGRTSCSRSWLERHVLSHGGNKPFRCIVDGCGQRFSSQTTLERHVNSHFNQTESSGSSGSTRRTPENASNKLFRRNGKKLRYRRQPWSARMFDYFDSGIMEGLQHRLLDVTEKITRGNVETAPSNTIYLQSKVLARRVELDGKTKVLLRWFPEKIIPDEWVLEADARPSRTVPIPALPRSALEPLHSALFSKPSPPRKNRRKQTKTT